jgi:hypothetical protein
MMTSIYPMGDDYEITDGIITEYVGLNGNTAAPAAHGGRSRTLARFRGLSVHSGGS